MSASRPYRAARHLFSRRTQLGRCRQGVAAVELGVELLDQALRQRGDRADLVEGRQPVADAQLHGAEARVRPDVPPDLAHALDGVGGDQRLHVGLELVPAGELVGQPRRRHGLEDLRARRRQARVAADPERRGRRQREEVRQVLAQRVDDGDRLVRRPDADVHVDAEDLQPAGQPLHPLDQLEVALLRRDELRLPVGERVGARAHEAEPAAVGGGGDLGERAGQVGLGLLDRGADAGDDLDRRLEQLVLGLRVLLGAVGPDLLEDLHRPGRQLPGLPVDELQLPLHAEAGAGRGLERDLHVGSLGSMPGRHPRPSRITRSGPGRRASVRRRQRDRTTSLGSGASPSPHLPARSGPAPHTGFRRCVSVPA